MTSLPVALDAHVPPLDRLARLVEVVDDGLHAADQTAALGVRVAETVRHVAPDADTYLLRVRALGDDPDGEAELGLLPIDGHPFDHLIGLVAPDDWWAVGVVAAGRARSLGAPAHDRHPPPPSRPARTTHLVARTGDAATVLRLGDDEPLTERHPAGERTTSLGAIDDGLRRVLGLPSAPPPTTTAELWAICWLDEVRAGVRAGVIDGAHWPSVAARHPLFTLTPELGEDGDATAHLPTRQWAIEHLDRAGRRFAHHVSWARLLADERLRDRPVHLDRDSLAWLDVGLFAREVLGALERPCDLLDELRMDLSQPVHRRVATTLRRWQLALNRT